MTISISIFFKSVDISTIDMSYRYIEQGYSQGVGAEGPFEMGQVRDVLEVVQLVLSAGLQKRGNLTKCVR